MDTGMINESKMISWNDFSTAAYYWISSKKQDESTSYEGVRPVKCFWR